jgi:uncharacterized protein YeaO (DUF488 family)
MMIRAKRVYEPPAADDGRRFLVDRLWPRGVKKATMRLDGWLKDVAPSAELRRWFGHKPARWAAFRRRYFAELDQHSAAWEPLLAEPARGPVKLLFSARDIQHNNAVALRDFLLAQLALKGNKSR